MNQPVGTVTLLFTDIEGSTRLLEQLGAERYREALDLHHGLVRDVVGRFDGYEVDTEGDAFFVAFGRARDGVVAAAEIQRAAGAYGVAGGFVAAGADGYSHGRAAGGAATVCGSGCASGCSDCVCRSRRAGRDLAGDG